MNKIKSLIVMLIVLMGVVVYASISAGMVEFIVKDDKGNPLEGVKIHITDQKAKKFQKDIVTNEDGKAKITLSFSHYDVEFAKEGYLNTKRLVKPLVGGRKREEVKLISMEAAIKEGKVKITPESQGIEAFNSAVELIKAGDNDGAIPLLEKALSLKPDIAPGYFNLGRLQFIKGELEKAEKNLLKSLEMNADFNPAYAMLAEIYKKNGDVENHKKYLKIAEERGAVSGADYYNQAVEAINAGDMEKAKPLLEKCLSIDKDFADAYYQLGIIYINEGKNDKCVEYLKKYLEIDPEGSNADAAKAIVASFGG